MSDDRASSLLGFCALATLFLSWSMPTRAADPGAIPLAMRVCAQGCRGPAVWTFMGKEGLGIWYGGATAKLYVERFDSGGITIRRKEIATRVSANIEGLYQGRIEGDTVTGTMSWWVGKAKPVVLPWTARIGGEVEQQVNARLLLHAIAGGYAPPGPPRDAVAYGADFARHVRAAAAATIARDAGATGATLSSNSASGATPPLAFVECEMEGCTAPATWRFGGDTGTTGLATWSTGAMANLTMERFDGDTVLIQRSEIVTPVSRDIVALYHGRITGDRIEGSMTWTAPGMMQPVTKPWWARIGTREEQEALAGQQLETLRARQKANDDAAIAQMMMWIGILSNSSSGATQSSGQRERESRNMRCSLTRDASRRGAASGEAVANACQ